MLALSALYVLKQPLPDVLKASIMDPIGASSTWHWEAYDNAWVEIDGTRMKSVTGGGHFGGGMFISAYDLARFGYLFLNNGKWGEPAARVREVDRDGPHARTRQRRLWFLQLVPEQPGDTARMAAKARLPLPSTPRSSVTFQGNGVNAVYLDWEHDLVIVVRWIDSNREPRSVSGEGDRRDHVVLIRRP